LSFSVFVQLIKAFKGVKELTAPVLQSLIDKITVSDRKKNADGELEQTITIYYKFVGLLDEFCTYPQKINRCAYEKICVKCGEIFSPGSNVAKYCSTCREEIRREQSNDSKRKSRAKAKQEVA
jgi:hypothetical protein